jgi:hypothetical protein
MGWNGMEWDVPGVLCDMIFVGLAGWLVGWSLTGLYALLLFQQQYNKSF